MGVSVKTTPRILCVEIAYLIKFHSKVFQSANEAGFCSIFPTYPALYSLPLSVLLCLSPLLLFSSHLPQRISPLHPAKPIRDLRASLPINYHPNQCRGLWYRIICQISADGWGQIPLCHRPHPRGNLCSGWACLMLPNLLMVKSLCDPGLQSSFLIPEIANV